MNHSCIRPWKFSCSFATFLSLCASFPFASWAQTQLETPDGPLALRRVVDWTPGSDWLQDLQANGVPYESTAASTSGGYSAYSVSPGTTLGRGERTSALLEQTARGLNYDPLAIFNWVLTRIEYVPYHGLVQGAHVTALEMRGNDYDQCVLLIALLKLSGVAGSAIQYKEGDVTYSNEQIESWLHWEPEKVVAVLTGEGILASNVAGGVQMRRVWVELNLDGTTYALDPAFKSTTRTSAIDVTSVYPPYSSTTLTNSANAVTVGDDEAKISATSIEAFQGSLSTMTSGYVRNAASTHHDRDGRALLGIPVISQSEVTDLPTMVHGTASVLQAWSEIPSERATKLRVYLAWWSAQAGYRSTWEREYEWCELGEDILSVRFGANSRATLYRNDLVEGTEAVADYSQTLFAAVVGVIRPQSPTVERRVFPAPVTRSGQSLLMWSHDSSRGRLKRLMKRQAALADSAPAGEDTLAHTLAVLALQRSVFDNNQADVAGALGDSWVYDAGSIWFYHARGSSWVVDGPGSNLAVRKIRTSITDFRKVWESVATLSDATEHLTLEQMSSSAASSTVAVFESALRSGKSIVRLRKEAWSSTISRVSGGANGILQGVSNYVNDLNYRAYVPSQLDNQIFEGNNLSASAALISEVPAEAGWSGWWRGIGYLINNTIAGGGSEDMAAGIEHAQSNTNDRPTDETADALSPVTGGDPVDLQTGAFLYEVSGLSLGDRSAPTGIDYRHSYSSALRLQNPVGLGRGWSHSYNLAMGSRHPNDIDIRSATVAEIAPLVIAARYMVDISTAEPTAKEIALRALAANWAARQFKKSQAVITLGSRRITFHRLPDGSYLQSSSIPATLERLGDGSHTLTFRHGNAISLRASDGKATSIVDPYSNELTLGYDSNGKLRTVTDEYNRALTFTYSGSDLVAVSDTTGRTVSYSRPAEFRVTDPEGGVTKFAGDTFGRITLVTDALDRPVIFNQYDPFDRVYLQRPMNLTERQTEIAYAPGVAREVDKDGNSSWSHFDARGRRTQYVDALGNRWSWMYDGSDRVIGAVSPKGGIWEWEYNSAHVLVAESNALGHSRTITPDPQDQDRRPWKIRNFEGKETVITYTDKDSISTIMAPGGLVTSFDYDTKGRLASFRGPSQTADTEFRDFDAYGNPQTVMHPDGRTSTISFNARGDLTRVEDRRAAKVTIDYDKNRRRKMVRRWYNNDDAESVAYNAQAFDEIVYDVVGDVDYVKVGAARLLTDPDDVPSLAVGRKIDVQYDALGELQTVRAGLNQTTILTLDYDQRGLLKKVTDALNHTTEFDYDEATHLRRSEDAIGRFTDFVYDADGNLTDVVSPMLHTQSWTFDLAGRVKTWQDPLDRVVNLDYDKDGRQTWATNRRNNTFTWHHDDDARKFDIETPLERKQVVEYNTRGLITKVTEPSQQTTNFTAWDSEGRVTAMLDGVGTVELTYWENGLLKEATETVAGTARTSYRGYDRLNRLVEYRDGEGNTLRYSYYPDNRLRTITYPDGVKTVAYGYDDFGRLKTVTDWSERVTTYHYDAAGRLTGVDRPNNTKRELKYNGANELRQVTERAANDSVIWFARLARDADGRITDRFVNPAPVAYSPAIDDMTFDEDNRLETFPGVTVIMDDDGNMTNGPLPSGGSVGYVYDSRNRLQSVGGVSYRYATDGQRVSARHGGVETTYVVDPTTSLSRTLVRKCGASTTYYVYGATLLYEEANGVTKTYHYDHLGSTVALTGEDGLTVTDRLQYGAFGLTADRSGSTDTPFLFHGAWGVVTDPNGLHYMRARYYNARLMRFISSDPIGFGGGMNWYAFASNSPTHRIDPWGLDDRGSSGGGFGGGWGFGSITGEPEYVPYDLYGLNRNITEKGTSQTIAIASIVFEPLDTVVNIIEIWSDPSDPLSYTAIVLPVVPAAAGRALKELVRFRLLKEVIDRRLTAAEKDAYREQAKRIWKKLTGRRAYGDKLDVHHRIPLEWSHLFPDLDPNRVENLVGVDAGTHALINDAWARWKSGMEGVVPTPQQVEDQAKRIDEMVTALGNGGP
jgi:RHS repeat-associated protein